jgi:hypothetical protein
MVIKAIARAGTRSLAGLIATLLILTGAASFSAKSSHADYPVGFRSWVHIKGAVIGPQSPAFQRYGGIHNIYANEQAVEGYRTGDFRDGSVIVFDLLEAAESGGTVTAGPRKFIDVMIRDSKRFAKTGGWGYAEFKGDSKADEVLTEDARIECYKCHAARKDRGFVFSELRE